MGTSAEAVLLELCRTLGALFRVPRQGFHLPLRNNTQAIWDAALPLSEAQAESRVHAGLSPCVFFPQGPAGSRGRRTRFGKKPGQSPPSPASPSGPMVK